jgi:hypothetical protein
VKNLEKAAPPLELVLKGGDPEKIALWGCGTCHISARTREEAVACCAPWVCEKCGKDVKSYCEDCSKKEQHERAQTQYDKAEKVMLSEYAGEWLCCDHCDEYYPDVDSLLDAHDDDDEPQTWAWGTYEVKFNLNAERVIEDELERDEFYDGAQDQISKVAAEELQTFLSAWSAKQDLNAYMVDNSVVVDFEALTNLRKKERDE